MRYIIVITNSSRKIDFFYKEELEDALDTLLVEATMLGGCSIIDLEEKNHYLYNNKLQLEETKKLLDK
jgi:hypothetical protein